MKKVALATAVLFVIGLTSSCKKDYTCCLYEDGVKQESVCVTSKMSKKDAEEIEEAGLEGYSGSQYEYKCEK